MEAAQRRSRWTLIAVSCAVAVYIATSALPQLNGRVPGDSPSFYFAARMAATGDIERLYDPAAIAAGWESLQQEGIHRRAAKHENYFLRPAFSAYLFSPFGFLSFSAAWRLFSVLCACAALVIAWKFPRWFGPLADDGCWVPWIFAYFPFIWSIGEGQDTILLTLCLGAALHLILQGRETAGGVVLALTMVKPHLAWGVPLALLVSGRRRAFAGFALTAAALMSISGALVGSAGFRQWIALLSSPETDLVPETMFNLRALALVAGSGPAFVVAGLLVASLAVVARRGAFSEALACGVLAPLLFSPHTYPQDLALAAILPFFAHGAWVKWAVFAPWLYVAPPGQGGNWIFLSLATAYLLSLGFRSLRDDAIPTERPRLEKRFQFPASQRT